jgi:exosortase A-associated hydrolase 2
VIVSEAKVSGHFLDAPGGRLAVVLWEPLERVTRRFAALYIPPFGDEMNKSRRMAAVQARAFAAAGGTVAIVDLGGTGDSSGDHAEATWEGWRDDVVVAWDWLTSRVETPVVLWGLRMGAMLAADIVDKSRADPAALVLWQPIASGRAFFNQFLRLANLRQRMGGAVAPGDAQSARKALAAGNVIEVAGYEVNPRLVAGADAVELAQLDIARCPVVLREVFPDDPPAISPFVANTIRQWRSAGAQVDAEAVNGPSFWISQEIAEAPRLVDATTSAILKRFSRQAGLVS